MVGQARDLHGKKNKNWEARSDPSSVCPGEFQLWDFVLKSLEWWPQTSSPLLEKLFSHVFFLFFQDIPALPKQRHFPGTKLLVAILEPLTDRGSGHRLISVKHQGEPKNIFISLAFFVSTACLVVGTCFYGHQSPCSRSHCTEKSRKNPNQDILQENCDFGDSFGSDSLACARLSGVVFQPETSQLLLKSFLTPKALPQLSGHTRTGSGCHDPKL